MFLGLTHGFSTGPTNTDTLSSPREDNAPQTSPGSKDLVLSVKTVCRLSTRHPPVLRPMSQSISLHFSNRGSRPSLGKETENTHKLVYTINFLSLNKKNIHKRVMSQGIDCKNQGF